MVQHWLRCTATVPLPLAEAESEFWSHKQEAVSAGAVNARADSSPHATAPRQLPEVRGLVQAPRSPQKADLQPRQLKVKC